MTDDEPLVMLQALQVHVDQLKAEMRDPDTSTQRIEEIRNELRQWYDLLREYA